MSGISPSMFVNAGKHQLPAFVILFVNSSALVAAPLVVCSYFTVGIIVDLYRYKLVARSSRVTDLRYYFFTRANISFFIELGNAHRGALIKIIKVELLRASYANLRYTLDVTILVELFLNFFLKNSAGARIGNYRQQDHEK